jgi:hypothetical protein
MEHHGISSASVPSGSPKPIGHNADLNKQNANNFDV